MSSTTHSFSTSSTLHIGDALAVLATLPGASMDAVVTDPPYAIRRLPQSVISRPAKRSGECRDTACASDDVCRSCARLDMVAKFADAAMLGQQSQNWHKAETHSRGYADNDPHQFGAWCGLWLAECLRVLKPGGHLVAFGGTRTWHRLATAAEDVGFEVRDSLAWLYSSGMPKSQDVARALGRVTSAGGSFGSDGSDGSAASWEGWGTALKPAFEPIVFARKPLEGTMVSNVQEWGVGPINVASARVVPAGGEAAKWPSNVHMDDAVAQRLGAAKGQDPANYFWVAKPTKSERVTVGGVSHPTVKPLRLMRHLVRLVTPAGGVLLDPFAGSGTTVEAAIGEGLRVIAIEREPSYLPLIKARIERCAPAPDAAGSSMSPPDAGTLF